MVEFVRALFPPTQFSRQLPIVGDFTIKFALSVHCTDFPPSCYSLTTAVKYDHLAFREGEAGEVAMPVSVKNLNRKNL